jgi:hypothetical protein
MAGDYMLIVDGIKGDSTPPMRRPSLGTLVAWLRQHGKTYLLTAVRHGAHDEATQRTLLALRSLGVQERPGPAYSALKDTGLGLIELQGLGGGTTPGSPPPVLWLISRNKPASHMLLPAVQRIREAHLRNPPKSRLMMFLSAGTPVRPGHDKWIELTSVSQG